MSQTGLTYLCCFFLLLLFYSLAVTEFGALTEQTKQTFHPRVQLFILQTAVHSVGHSKGDVTAPQRSLSPHS